MHKDFINSYKELSDAYGRLKSGSMKAKEDYEKEMVAQRFEFTFGLLLKYLKILLKERRMECKFPKECIKAAARFGLIPNENIYIEMLEDRYKIAQLRGQKIPDELYRKIKVKYIIVLGKFLGRIEKEFIIS